MASCLCHLFLQALFWYKAKNSSGQEGLVPRTFLEIIADEGNCIIIYNARSKGSGLTFDSLTLASAAAVINILQSKLVMYTAAVSKS